MPIYVYKCLECEANYQSQIESGQIIQSEEGYESGVLYETSHSMNPSPKELGSACVCPRCKSTKSEKTLHGHNFTTFVRGYGWMDKNGVHRDMHTHTLMNNDPYKQYRQEGEIDHIKENLGKKGKRDPKPQHFVGKVSAADVQSAVYKNNTEP
jgi:hypothetical protein